MTKGWESCRGQVRGFLTTRETLIFSGLFHRTVDVLKSLYNMFSRNWRAFQDSHSRSVRELRSNFSATSIREGATIWKINVIYQYQKGYSHYPNSALNMLNRMLYFQYFDFVFRLGAIKHCVVKKFRYLVEKVRNRPKTAMHHIIMPQKAKAKRQSSWDY